MLAPFFARRTSVAAAMQTRGVNLDTQGKRGNLNMNMQSFVTIAALLYIAYKLTQLVAFYSRNQEPGQVASAPPGGRSSTLNPLFSEEDVTHMKQQYEKADKCAVQYCDKLSEQETAEVEVRRKAGLATNLLGKPSDNLNGAMVLAAAGLVGRNNAKRRYHAMIESNIAILNGAKLEQVETAYYDQPGTVWIPADTTMSPDAWLLDTQVKEMYAWVLKERTQAWRDNNGPHIVGADYGAD